MSTLLQDLRFAMRTLQKRWMVTLLAVLSLSLAIGGNAAVFSMVDAFLFRPLPYPEPERIVLVGEREKEQREFSGTLTSSLPTYTDWVERSRSIATWGAMQPTTLSLRGSEHAEPISAIRVIGDFFEVLRATPFRGRSFSASEMVEGGPRVALLGYDYWVRTFGLQTDPIGEVLTLSGEPYEIIGVMTEGFEFLTPNQDVFVPLARSPESAPRDQRTIISMGRLAQGVSTGEARAEMAQLASTMETEFAETQRGWTVDTYNLRYDIPDPQSRALFGMLQGSVLLVLIIACVNITNLLLAQGQERAREIALRTALGAGRTRIVRQLLTESAVMVTVGGAIGVALASVGIRVMAAQFAGVLPANWAIQLDGRVLLFTLAITVTAGFMFGMVPALQTFQQGQSETLKEGGGRGGTRSSRKLLSRALVVGEIALSFVALGGGSLLVRSFLEIQSSDPGFEAGPVLTAVVSVPTSKYPEDEDRMLLNDEILQRAQDLGGVESAALVNVLPQTPLISTDTFRVDGAAIDAGGTVPRGVIVQASPDYPATMGIQLLQGRFFEPTDRLDAAPVVAVSQALASVRFENRSPVGSRITVRGESREIVGVVEDVQQVLVTTAGTSSGETIYLPAGQAPKGTAFVILRTRGDPREAGEPLRGAIQSIDPDMALSQIQTMEEYVAQFFVGVQIFNAVLGGFGLLALLLASLGTYGVLAYSVSRRSHEIGIRMALGAKGGQVVRMIAKQGIVLSSIGLAIGVALTLPLVGVLGSLLEGLSTVEPTTLVLIGALLFGVTLFASFVPAGRAASVDPMRTLRDE